VEKINPPLKEEVMNKGRVLITGGAGFIGSHTAQALAHSGYRVRVLDNLDPQIHGPKKGHLYTQNNVEFLYGDVRNPQDVKKALEDVDSIFHFAALTGVGQSMYDMRNYEDVNVTGTANLLEAVVKGRRPLKKFILASSRAVYGEGTHWCSKCGPVYPSLRQREDLEKRNFSVYCGNCRKKIDSIPTKESRPLQPVF